MREAGCKRFVRVAGAVVALITAVSLLYSVWFTPQREITYGATFSLIYADYLGIDARQTYIAAMDDLGIEAWRIPVYWSHVEPEPDVYVWDDLDWMMDQAAVRNVPVTLAIGLKVPRWPECFLPEWLPEEQMDQHMYDFLQEVVVRYRDHDALMRWQVENEPFFPFGECPAPSPERIINEFEIVRRLDPHHPIQSTTSGEQSLWFLSASRVDVLGVSVYREVYLPVVGTFVFPFTPMFYEIQRVFTEPFVDKVIVSELQAEPWFEEGPFQQGTTTEELYRAFSVEDLTANTFFARKIGVDEVYFWGVEWWMWLKEQGDERLWNTARGMIQE